MDEITAGLVVQAVAKGFEAIITQLDELVKAEQRLSKETEATNRRREQASQASRKLAEEKRRSAEASRLAAEQARKEREAYERLVNTTNKSANILLGLAAAGGVAIASTTALAARVETLGVVVNTLGGNLGYTNNEMRGFEDALVSQGITLQKSREGIALMAQANLDLTQSLELAKLAQDAAVIAGTDSSEAFRRLVYTITAGNVRMARTMGLQVNFQDAFRRTAEETGRLTTEFDANEKANIRMQEVLRAGINIQGAYDAAMETDGKKVTSLNRNWEESRRLIGEEWVPAYGAAIDIITDGLVSFQEMDAVQRRILVTLASSLVSWAAMTGGIAKAIAVIMKLRAAIQAVGFSQWIAQFGVLGPVGLFAAAITAVASAIHIYNIRIEEQQKKNKEFQESLMENVTTFDDYVAGMKQYGDQQGIMVVSAEEYEQALQGARQGLEATAETMGQYDEAMVEAYKTSEALRTGIVLMSEETFDLAMKWAQYTDAATAMEAATKLQGASLAYYAEHGRDAAIVTGLFDSKIRDSVYHMQQATKEARNLDAAMQHVAEKAMKDYAEGQDDAIQRMIYDLVKAQISLGEYGEETDGVLSMIGDKWGLTGDITTEAIEQISLWLKQAADSGDWETFLTNITRYANGLELASHRQDELAESAESAYTPVEDLIDMAGQDVGSAIESFIRDIKWFMAGGYKIVQYFESIKALVGAGIMAPEVGVEKLKEALPVFEALAVQMGEQSRFDAATTLVNNMEFGYDALIAKNRAATLYQEKYNEAIEEGVDITDELNDKMEAEAHHDAVMEQYYQQAYELLGIVEEDLPGAIDALGQKSITPEDMIAAKELAHDLYETLLKIDGM